MKVWPEIIYARLYMVVYVYSASHRRYHVLSFRSRDLHCFCSSKRRLARQPFLLLYLADSTIDYLAQYRLVDKSKLELYGRPFALEDEDEDDIITYEVR